jgi:hypothetical protein
MSSTYWIIVVAAATVLAFAVGWLVGDIVGRQRARRPRPVFEETFRSFRADPDLNEWASAWHFPIAPKQSDRV